MKIDASREEMKQEAIRRLMILNLHKNVIEELINEDIIYRTEFFYGILFWLDDEEQKIVENFEKKWNVFVYHIIKTVTTYMGTIYDLLYVTNEKNEWENERKEAENGYVLSHTISAFSESGYIMVESKNGGLIRIG